MSDETPVQMYPPWREALEQFRKAGFAYGQVVPSQWFYDAFGIPMPKPDTPYERGREWELERLDQFTAMRKVLLEEDKMYLRAVRIGYEIVLPSQQTALVYKTGLKRARKALRDMGRGLVNVDLVQLTDEQRKQNADALARLAQLKSISKRTRGWDLLE